MPGNATATVLAGAGNGITAAELQTLCEAFGSAVENFCKDENKKSRKHGSSTKDIAKRRGRFNDFFYRSLAKRDSGLAGAFSREVGGVFTKVGWGRTSRYLGTIADVAKGAGNPPVSSTAVAAASAMFGVLSGQPALGRTGANRFLDRASDGMRGAVVGSFKNANSVTAGMRRSVYTRWSDGSLSNGRVLELKGPGDTPRPGQLADEKKMGNGLDPILIGCDECGMTCKNGCP